MSNPSSEAPSPLPAAGLKRRLLLLLLGSVTLSVVLVGLTLAFLSQHIYEEESHHQFAAAQQLTLLRLQQYDSVVRSQSQSLAERPGIVATVNMINAYQSKEDYRPLVFDGEKQQIAIDLKHAASRRLPGIDAIAVAIYDNRGDLVSFARVEGETADFGYMAFEQGQPLVQVAVNGAGNQWRHGQLPAVVSARYAGAAPVQTVVTRSRHDPYLTSRAVAPIKRHLPDGSTTTLGVVVYEKLYRHSFVERISQESNTKLALVLDAETDARDLFGMKASARLIEQEGRLLEDQGEQGSWIDTPSHFVQPFRLPLDGGEVYLLFAIEKAPVTASIRRTRMVVLAVLVLAALLVVPAGLSLARRSISDPVSRLVSDVEAIRDGRYPSRREWLTNDELGWLARSVADMGDTIRRREAELLESRASLAEAQRIAQLGNWELTLPDGRLAGSDELFDIIGITRGEISGGHRWLLPFVFPEDQARVATLLDAAANDGVPYAADYRLVLPDGSLQIVHETVEVKGQAERDSQRIVGTLQVVTELKKVERQLRKVNRALKTLSACNETLVHAHNEQELLDNICRMLVVVGHYRLAWVGFADHDAARRVRPVARAGSDTDYLDQIEITWGDGPKGQGPTGTAIRTATPQIMRDILHDPRFEPWRFQARQRGYASSIAFPLCDPAGRAFGALNLYASEPNAFDEEELELLRELAGDLAYGIAMLRAREEHEQVARERTQFMAQVQAGMEKTVQVLASTIELRDPYTAGHQRRVSLLARRLAEALGLAEDQVIGIYMGAMVHDIGKINIPAELLSRPGKLSDIEFSLIKTHPVTGYDILKEIDFPWPVADIVVQHHERLDGSGYPHGLKGDEIILPARILAVADVLEAMFSHRPYRAGLGLDAGLDELRRHRGILYDPEVVDVCLALFKEQAYSFE